MPSRFHFGLFELDVETLELRRRGAIVHLPAQPARVLSRLVRNADRIVSRDELRKAIWGEETFVDFERGLNFCISQIRSALNDDASKPVYVRTVARQGYQFIAPVTESRNDIPSESPDRPSKRTLLYVAATLLALISIAFTARRIRVGTTQPPLPIVAVVRFDNETENPTMAGFADNLTDTFVERFTSLGTGHYKVIGNALALRGPREGRDIGRIAANLRADYVVLGQVQAHQGETRILLHLIHMPEQTHVSVARLDRELTDPLKLEAEAAQTIAMQFSQRLVARR